MAFTQQQAGLYSLGQGLTSSANSLSSSIMNQTTADQRVQQKVAKGEKANTALGAIGSVAGTAALATSIFASAAASNAIPIAGQIASAGLAIAGLLTKIFTGRKAAKKAKRVAAENRRQDEVKQDFSKSAQADAASNVGQASGGQSLIATTKPTVSSAPSFSAYGGGQAPTTQPAQQVINSTLGFN